MGAPPAPCAKEIASAGKRLLRSVIVQGAAIEEWVDIAGGLARRWIVFAALGFLLMGPMQ